jgi:hypothetical protein
MEEDCFGIAQCYGMQQLQCVREFRISSEPLSSNMFLEFRISKYSVIPWNSANPIYRGAAYSDAGQRKKLLIK